MEWIERLNKSIEYIENHLPAIINYFLEFCCLYLEYLVNYTYKTIT